MKRLLGLILLMITACSTVPFRETERVQLGEASPDRVVERFRTGLPDGFHLLNTVVFEYNWRKFGAVGYLDINRPEGVFNLVCLNPMGVKLFELTADRDRVTNLYTIAALSRYGDITTLVGTDIRRIYFDLVPSSEARITRGATAIRFRQSSGSGTMEYVFSGPQADLVEKNYYDDNGLAWRVSYYEYREQDGKRFPQGVVFLNYQYHYRLTVRHKEFHS